MVEPIAPLGERRSRARTPRQPDDLETAPAPTASSARRRAPELRLHVIGSSRIEVEAIGNFDADSRDTVSSRLDRLMAGGPGCVHVDCTQVASMDRAVAELFAGVRDRLRSRGVWLEVVGAPLELQRMLNATPNAAAAPTSAPAVAS